MISNGEEWQDHVGKWQHHLDYIQKNSDFNDIEKKYVLNGLNKLRTFFEDAWLWEITKPGHNTHRLVSFLTNYARWS
jgi:hypothetical protein